MAQGVPSSSYPSSPGLYATSDRSTRYRQRVLMVRRNPSTPSQVWPTITWMLSGKFNSADLTYLQGIHSVAWSHLRWLAAYRPRVKKSPCWPFWTRIHIGEVGH